MKYVKSMIYKKEQAEFRDYSNAMSTWREDIKKDADFYWGKQWSSKDRAILEGRGHSALVINRVFPIIEQKKAVLGQVNPSFTFIARGNGDEKFADSMSQITRMIWDTSQASSEFIDVLHNRSVYGVGYFLPYYDPNALLGDGEIRLASIHPLDVYFDPNIKKSDFSDAKSYYIYKVLTKDQLISIFPGNKDKIASLSSRQNAQNEFIGTSKSSQDNQYNYGDEQTYDNQEKVYVAERHSSKYIPIYTVQDRLGVKKYYKENEFNHIKSLPDFIIASTEGKITVKKWFKRVTHVEIFANWEVKLYDEIIDVPYPIIVPFVEHNPQNGKFISDIRMVRSQQEEVNKRRSLIIAHLTTQVNTKWIGEENSVDVDKWSEDMAIPSVFLQYRKGFQKPDRISPEPIPNGLFQEESESKYDIEYTLGTYDYMMGSSRGAHPTARGIATLADMGGKRTSYAYYKIARSFESLGLKVLHFIKNYYTNSRILRVAGGQELYLNIEGHDQAIDISQMNVLEYDITVSETTLSPSHRQAKASMLKEYADQGYVRKSLVTQELDIPDANKEAQVIDEINQLSQQLKGLADDNKQLVNKAQNQERLIESLQRQVELERFRTKLASDIQGTQTAVQVTRELAKKALTVSGRQQKVKDGQIK